MTRTALLLALPLSYLTTCMPYRHHLVGWEYDDPTHHAGIYEYEVTPEQALTYFMATDSACVSGGWTFCPYVQSAQIELFGDGSATVHQMLVGSAFEPVLPIQTTWFWDHSAQVPIVDLAYWLPVPSAWTVSVQRTTVEE